MPPQLRRKGGFPVAHLSRFRQGAYRLFGGLLLYPEGQRFKTTLEAARQIYLWSQHQDDLALFDRWQPLFTALMGADVTGSQRIQEEYLKLFVANPGGIPCPPYESAYLDQQRHAAGWIVAQLDQEYAVAGLCLSPGLHEMPDHAAVELEFMSFMCGQEADAWGREAVKEGVQALERQADFLDRHLTRWFPAWAQQVATADGEGIYSVVTATAQAFISHDQDLISLLLDKFRSMPPATQGEAVGKVGAKKRPRSGSHRHAP